MNAEIIAVGTEMLLGEIVNTNAQYVAKLLARYGVPSYYQTVVGDNPKRLASTIELAETRSHLIFLIGGLGPTPDDLTKQTLAQHLGISLKTDANALAKLTAWQQQTQKKMPANNLAQAYYLDGGEPLKNQTGLAVGSYLSKDDHDYFVLPGPPREMLPMVDHEVEPRLARLAGRQQIFMSRMLRFFGSGESSIADCLADLIDQQRNPTIATYIKDYEVGVRLTARADSEEAAMQLLTPLITEVKNRLSEYYVGAGEDRRVSDEVVRLLKEKQLTVTAAESLTAGLFQATLASISGASEVFPGGFVTYANGVKEQLLGIKSATIEDNGVVSAKVAEEMAELSERKLSTDFGLGFTGVAGPDELEGKPVGTVFIALAMRDRPTIVAEYHFAGERNEIRGRSVEAGLKMLYDQLNNK
ncbi:competence/damage-inducible protein A [Lapidilactobacillus bayanensis]|uniref:competence/damage-inducible protein A n=1 Tax=Lapidilactobacillus bayanensis TaxID=2485998 RepID=UPI000F797A7A|nr:competence/damage-inducible protein A [Lapidilactobacillus bayanensis]